MSDSTDLKIAEMLKQEKTYREIQKELHAGPETIKKVRDYIAQEIIQFNEEGKAYLAAPAKKTIEEIHTDVMEVVTRKATETALKNAEEDYALGNEIRQYWALKAQELGLDIREFVKAALIFYDEYRDQMQTIQERLDVADEAFDALRRNVDKEKALELYYRFITYCLYLKVKEGLDVTQAVVDAFWQDLNKIIGGLNANVGGKESA